MEYSGIQVGEWWPLLAGLVAAVSLLLGWQRHKGSLFPDDRLLRWTSSTAGVVDRLPLLLGGLITCLLLLALMDISATRSIVVNKRARDFLLIADTSRSMRENTSLLRSEYPPKYERRTGLYAGEVDDPSTIPELGRYELARESLLRFMDSLNPDEDRIELIYFNSQVYLMSGFTSNFDFIEQQLANMDPYVTYGTNIHWVLEKGLDMIERYPRQNRQAVILLTDAEAKSTDRLQQQLDRLGKQDISFYLLWIATSTVSAQAKDFLRNARAIGSVFTIEDMAEGSLDDALKEIGKLENYPYEELRHERLELSEYMYTLARWLMLIWILLIATLYHPTRLVSPGGRS